MLQRFEGLKNRQYSRTGSQCVSNNLFEQIRRASPGSWSVGDIVGGKNEPPTISLVLIYKILNALGVPAFLQEESRKVVEVDISDIKSLAATPAANKVFCHSPLCTCPRHTYGVRKG